MSAALDSVEARGGASEAPLTAIVTPVYNGDEFLRATMEAVQAQTYPNLVHVVLDNASTDGTAAIIADFAGKRVPVLAFRNEKTIPLPANWSAAMEHAPKEAKYLTVLCADDLITPDFVAKMVAVAESDPGVELVGTMHRLDDKVVATTLPRGCAIFDGKKIAADFLNKKSNELPHMWGLYRRREEDFVAPFFDEAMMHFDTGACLRALARGKFGFVREPVYIYRMHAASVTETVVKGSTHRRIDGMREIEQWAPKVMSPRAVAKAKARQARFIHRAMREAKSAGRQDLFDEYAAFLSSRGFRQPMALDYLRAEIEWPLHRIMRRLRILRAQFS
ncbi:MAG: glycosyltransferase family A protein [Hyphomonadaceae bacterium]